MVSGLVGGAVSNLLLRGGPAMAQAGGAVQDVVRAKKFQVVDDQGKKRAALGLSDDGGPALLLYDADGKKRAGLFLASDGSPSLSLYRKGGTVAWHAP